ncbi:MAG: DNA methylase N-4 [Alphaproteobacteria bacterium]|nr:DNA methylase N-4 [Alphaproteobacteria bacterium]
MSDLLQRLEIAEHRIDELKPYPRNARTHSKKQIRQIAASIKEFGFTNPILIDGVGRIIAGHGRVEAAKLLGRTSVPTIRLEHLSPEQVRAYIIADNRLAELAGWDDAILATELQVLSTLDLGFDLDLTGFETAEIDLLIGSLEEDDTPDEPEPAFEGPDRSRPAVSVLGDLWRLGDHLLLCGDALKRESYAALMGDEKAQMVFTDPPYNVPIAGHVSGLGKIKHDDFAMACGEMSESEFTGFLRTAFRHMADFSLDGSLHYLCMDWRHAFEILGAGRAIYREFKNLCVWNKNNGGMGSFYRSKHELVFVFKNGTATHINNVELGRYGRSRTNVWDYPGASSLAGGRGRDLALHPTVKPVALVADAIHDASKRGGIILDPFAGSGSTILAAEKTGRHARAIELDPHYVDTIIRRFQKETGIDAVVADSGLPFNALA